MDSIICARRISRYLKGKYTGGFRRGFFVIQDSERISGKYKEIIWRRK